MDVSHRIRLIIFYYILNKNGQIEPRTIIQHVISEDMRLENVTKILEKFDKDLIKGLDNKKIQLRLINKN